MNLQFRIIAIVFAISLSSLQAASGKHSAQLAVVAARCFATNTKSMLSPGQIHLSQEIQHSQDLIKKIDAGLEILSLENSTRDPDTTFDILEKFLHETHFGNIGSVSDASTKPIKHSLPLLVFWKRSFNCIIGKPEVLYYLNWQELKTPTEIIDAAQRILETRKNKELKLIRDMQKLLDALNYTEPKPNRIM